MKKTYLGLDIGTNSVGWALTNENYELIHLRGKSAWGVHMFDEANTAKERRNYRSTRRRKARIKRRINLLQDLFAAEMAKVDPLFFTRLNNSTFFSEDKDKALLGKKDSLFSDKNFTDKDFYKNEKTKTIYHLQKLLIDDKNTKYDLRFIYLAIHHLIKYRGHFHFEGQNINIDEFGKNQIKEGFEIINDYLSMNNLTTFVFSADKIIGFEKIVENERGINNTKKALKDLFNTKEKIVVNILDFIANGKVKLKKIFDNLELQEEENFEIDFSVEDFETQYVEAEAIIGEEHIVLIDAVKQLNDYLVVARLMNGEKFVAHAMVKKYNKHKEDLRKLKKIIKENCSQEQYDTFFKAADQENNYPAYIGMTKIRGARHKIKKLEKPSEINKFFRNINEIIKNIHSDSANNIREEIEKGIFLPRITSVENSQIPHQFNAYQLEIILNNSAKHYPFLNKKEEGLTLKEKIIKLLTFRVPYYVGPLSDKHQIDSKKGGFSWIVRKSNKEVLPWNLDKVIDLEKTAEQFILKMTNKCSYLIGEDVLPKQSLLYEEYNLLNHFNVIRINGERLSKVEKEALIENIAKKRVNVTYQTIAKYFDNRLKKDVTITGIDEEMKLSLSSFHKFNKIFPGRINNEPQNAKLMRNLEKIVFLGTIYSSQVDFTNRLKSDKEFNKFFSTEEISKMANLRFKGWGSFSRLLLTGFDELSKSNDKVITYQDEKTGNELSIIEIMREEPLNFNEVLFHEKYQFSKLISEFNHEGDSELSVDELIDNYYVSPAVRRSIRRTLKIVDEVIATNNGIIPDKIFVEVTREDEKTRKGKGRTDSRLEKMRNIYKKAIKDAEEFRVLLDEISKDDKNDDYLRPKKMYLYYLQNGKCAYTGEPLNLKDASIDHIIPRSLVKDDSFDNLVLVKDTVTNQRKTDEYPLNFDIIQKQKPLWLKLKRNGLMSNVKYEKLTRTRELTAEDFEGFVNRQLVITNQANKAIAEILKTKYGVSTIVYSKASNVTDFRQKFNLIKGREINNAHHAHDAYLNIVVGNYFNTRFGARYYYRDDKKFKWNPKTVFNFNVGGCWDKDKDLGTVKKMLNRRDILFTRMPIIETGQFYNQKASKAGDNLIPIKEKGPLSDTTKYGGYSDKKTAYFAIIEHTAGNKRERIFISIPVIINQKIIQKQTTLVEYLKTQLKLVEPNIIYSPIPINTIVKRGQSLQFISGVQGSGATHLIVRNMIEPYFDDLTFEYLCLINKYFERKAAAKVTNEDEQLSRENIEKIQVIFSFNEKEKTRKNDRLRYITRDKNEKAFECLIKQIEKPIYEKSFGSRREKILENMEKFYDLKLVRQVEIIRAFHEFLKTGVPAIKIKLEELGVKSGTLTMSYKLEDMTIVKQSITGLYQKEIHIKEV